MPFLSYSKDSSVLSYLYHLIVSFLSNLCLVRSPGSSHLGIAAPVAIVTCSILLRHTQASLLRRQPSQPCHLHQHHRGRKGKASEGRRGVAPTANDALLLGLSTTVSLLRSLRIIPAACPWPLLPAGSTMSLNSPSRMLACLFPGRSFVISLL